METREQYAKCVYNKVNNKDTRAMSFEHIWRYEFGHVWTHFIHFFGVSIVVFEQDIAVCVRSESSFKIRENPYNKMKNLKRKTSP